MMNEPQDDPEIDSLFRAVLDQNLTEAQAGRLEEILLTDAKAREDYLRLTEIDHFLQVCYHGDDVPVAVSQFKPSGKRISAFWMAWAGICIVSACLLGWFFRTEPQVEIVDKQVPVEFVPEPILAATLTGSIDAVWGKNSAINELPVGTQWNVGDRVELKEGTALLTFANNVKCAITGEVLMKVDDDLNCLLEAGIGTFDVPESATGFTVHTLGGSFVDVGTSFGVNVSDQGNSEVHVLKGVVNAVAVRTGSAKVLRLTSGNAARLTPATETLSSTAFRPEAFSRPLALIAGVERLSDSLSFWSQPLSNIVPGQELRRPVSAWLCKEKSEVELTQDLVIKSMYGNRDSPHEYRDVRIPAGTRLDSYLLHFSHDSPLKARDLFGTITFASPVAALIRSHDELRDTDAMFCFEQTVRDIKDAISKRRGSDEAMADVATVDDDSRTVQFQLSTLGAPSLDQMRILVLRKNP